MKVDSLHLEQLSVFEKADLVFSPGINVFLGTNGTGKSHAMKALYAPLKAIEESAPEEVNPHAYTMKLRQVFKPDRGDLDRLVRRGAGDRRARIDIVVEGARISLTLGNGFQSGEHLGTRPAKALFLPSRELLSMYEGFLAAYKGRELSFDETYYDACFALSATALRGERYEETAALRAPLEAAIGGPVVLEGSRFFVRKPDGDMEPHLLAEGWRKLASVAHLIANGSLSAGTAFFWDEPEAGLNPQIVEIVVDLLFALAERGVQIFVATHDYLVSQKLSLISDYGQRPATPIRFFGFQRRDGDGAVTVASGDTIAALPDDPIHDEFVRHYDFARALFDGEERSA
jgi:AAA domain, putative AbiEii toxin, Type IV TA system/AAA domain